MAVVPEHARTLTNAPADDGFDGIDRLSDLPNDILCHILSFLPTKYAVGTSVLSVRWKNLVPLIRNLQIELRDTFLHRPNSASDISLINFKNFVDRLLNVTLRDVTSASRFHLHCEKFNEGRDIAKWIAAALCLNVKSMALLIREPMNSDFIFESLFGANITHLVLMLDFADTAPEFRFNMPNLKVLSVRYMGANDVNVLLEGCPVLEHLEIYNCDAYPEEVLCVRNPLLRILKFYNRMDYFDGDLEISTPKLEYLLYDGFHPNHYIVQRLESLERAHLSLDENYDIYQYGLYLEYSVLLGALSCIKWLWVSEKVIRMFCYCPAELLKFENLVCMEIDKMESYVWELLPYMLFYVPTFKCLSVKSGFDLESYRNFKSSVNMLPNSLYKSVNFFVVKRSRTRFDMVFRRNAEESEATGAVFT